MKRLLMGLDLLGWKNIKDLKRVYFDVDGTLSIPVYKGPNYRLVAGGSQEWWKSYCLREQDKAYDFCKSVPVMKDFMQWNKEIGIETKVLTVEFPGPAEKAKIKFIKDNYPLVEDIIVVRDSKDKLTYMQAAALENKWNNNQIAIVEDNFETIMEACSLGFVGIPVSYFLAL